jgi:hypothetical protein
MALYIFFELKLKQKILFRKFLMQPISFPSGAEAITPGAVILSGQSNKQLQMKKKLGNVYYYRQCATPTRQVD